MLDQHIPGGTIIQVRSIPGEHLFERVLDVILVAVAEPGYGLGTQLAPQPGILGIQPVGQIVQVDGR